MNTFRIRVIMSFAATILLLAGLLVLFNALQDDTAGNTTPAALPIPPQQTNTENNPLTANPGLPRQTVSRTDWGIHISSLGLESAITEVRPVDQGYIVYFITENSVTARTTLTSKPFFFTTYPTDELSYITESSFAQEAILTLHHANDTTQRIPLAFALQDILSIRFAPDEQLFYLLTKENTVTTIGTVEKNGEYKKIRTLDETFGTSVIHDTSPQSIILEDTGICSTIQFRSRTITQEPCSTNHQVIVSDTAIQIISAENQDILFEKSIESGVTYDNDVTQTFAYLVEYSDQEDMRITVITPQDRIIPFTITPSEPEATNIRVIQVFHNQSFITVELSNEIWYQYKIPENIILPVSFPTSSD